METKITFLPPIKSRLLYRLKIIFIFLLFGASLGGQAQTMLRASGSTIVDANNNEVVLRGMGLGGWLLMEGYMLQVNGGYGQWQIKRDMYQQGASATDIETFFANWRNAHTTSADMAYMKSLGFNSVRLPMHYELFLTASQRAVRANVAYGIEPVTNYVEALSTWYDQNLLFTDVTVPGFATITNTLQWAAANGMWVVLDMHAAPGGQGSDTNINDALVGLDLYNRVDSKGRKIYQLVLERLWKAISSQYKADGRVAMYDLLNEPHGSISSTALKSIYDQVINAIRSNGDNHLIALEGRGYGNEHTGITPDLFPGQSNLVWSGHRYWVTNDPAVKDRNANQLNLIANLVNFRAKWNVPVWVGETGENSNHWLATACKNLDDKKIGWALWTHKRLMGTYNGQFEITASPLKIKYADIYTAAGRSTLLQNIQFANCLKQEDVVDAMTRMINDQTSLPFSGTRATLPGKIFATDFDRGRNGVAYKDNYFEKIPYNGDNWNSGYAYRNDGVDIQPGQDATGNGANIGWFENGEWLNYSVNVTTSGSYKFECRLANGGRQAGALAIKVDGVMAGTLSVPVTGDYQIWSTVSLSNLVNLAAGNHTIQIACTSRNGGGNFSWFSFTSASARQTTSAENVTESGLSVSPNPFADKILIQGIKQTAQVSVFDLTGRELKFVKTVSSGDDVLLDNLNSGVYILSVNEGVRMRSIRIIKK
jgi:endoglucanase